ncbi:MAG: hypothetical protein V3V13_10270 [Paracoccaceae bacterium]
MFKNILVATLITPLLFACAGSSEDIAAAYVSPDKYSGYSCRQIEREARQIAEYATRANAAQDEQASDDAGVMAVGAILFLPALFFIGGDDENASEVARLKGELQALEQVSNSKRCGIVFSKAPEAE